jgi:hypothetical protein
MRIEIFIVVIIVFGLLSASYWWFYYKRLSLSLKNKNVRSLRFSPLLMTMLLALISLGVITTDTYVYAVSLENKIIEIDDEYENVEFSNDYIREIYIENNIYFAGYFYQDDVLVLCLKEDTPLTLIQKAKDYNQEVRLVEHNYNDLLAIYRIVANERVNLYSEESMTVYIDFKENTVVVGTDEPDKYLDVYSVYISEGLLKIVETDSGSYAID